MSKKCRNFLRSLLIGALSLLPATGLALNTGIVNDGSSARQPGTTQETRQDIRDATNPQIERSGVGMDVSIPGVDAHAGVDTPGFGVSVDENDPESGSYYYESEEGVDTGSNTTTEEVDIQKSGVGVGVYYGRPTRNYYARPYYGRYPYRYYRHRYHRPYRNYNYQGYYPYYNYYQYHNYNYGW